MKLNFILPCFLLFAFANLNTAKAQAVDAADSLALVDLYNSCNGLNWPQQANWLNGPISTWYGIYVSGLRVYEINLAGNNLAGRLPASFGNLTAVSYMDLGYNQLKDTLPASFCQMTSLQVAHLNNNQLTRIPYNIGNLQSLIEIDINYNQLKGKIPVSIGDCSNAYLFDFSYNHLSGSLPSSIGKLANLKYFRVNYNEISGEIPFTFGNLILIKEISLSNNRLTGSIPASMLNIPDLGLLNLQYNHMSQSNNIVSSKSYGAQLNIFLEYNNCTFNGLEYLKKNHFLVSTSPQAPINIHQHDGGLAVSAGGTLHNNTYKWFMVGSAVSTVIAHDSTFQPTQSAQYYAQVTNSIVYQLTLQTDTVSYTVPLAKNALSVSVYPNPVKDILSINNLDEKNNCKITIADINGIVWISTASKQQKSLQCNISKLKPGNYLLAATNGSTINTVHFIKE